MPRYRIRLDDPDSDEFRVTYVSADSPEDAKAWAERREQTFCEYRLTKDELKEAGKANKILHEQTTPYEVTEVEKRGDQKSEKKGKA